MCGLFLSKVYYSQLDFKIRLTRCTHSVCPRFLHIPGPQEGQISPGAELLEQLSSSRAVAADVPYQLAEKLLSIVSSRFSLRNLLGLGFFFSLLLKMWPMLVILSCLTPKEWTTDEIWLFAGLGNGAVTYVYSSCTKCVKGFSLGSPWKALYTLASAGQWPAAWWKRQGEWPRAACSMC